MSGPTDYPSSFTDDTEHLKLEAWHEGGIAPSWGSIMGFGFFNENEALGVARDRAINNAGGVYRIVTRKSRRTIAIFGPPSGLCLKALLDEKYRKNG